MSDPVERAGKFLQQCGSCDAGLPMACTCPDEDFRPVMLDLVQEIERLRADAAAVARRAYESGQRDLIALKELGF